MSTLLVINKLNSQSNEKLRQIFLCDSNIGFFGEVFCQVDDLKRKVITG